MGFLSRLLVPRSVRRVMHPARTVKRAVTPKAVKRARRALHPVDNAVYSLEGALTTKRRTRRSMGQVFRHGSCPVRHRTAVAAARCRHL